MVDGGSAGAAAATHARELGADATLVEAQQVGRTNLNSGPAPVPPCPGPPGWPGTGPRGSALAWTAAPSWATLPGARLELPRPPRMTIPTPIIWPKEG